MAFVAVEKSLEMTNVTKMKTGSSSSGSSDSSDSEDSENGNAPTHRCVRADHVWLTRSCIHRLLRPLLFLSFQGWFPSNKRRHRPIRTQRDRTNSPSVLEWSRLLLCFRLSLSWSSPNHHLSPLLLSPSLSHLWTPPN